MVCYTRVRPKQTLTERKAEVETAVQKLDRLVSAGSVRVVIGPTGGVAFQGWPVADRSDVTDTCAFRRIMSTGSATAKMAIARAEALAGRTVDKTAVAQGLHSHDGGRSWHKGH